MAGSERVIFVLTRKVVVSSWHKVPSPSISLSRTYAQLLPG